MIKIKKKRVYTDEELPQGSERWLEIRTKHGTATEAASVMSISPFN